jgi:DNA-binding NarL/FixJ family response regulator
MVDSTPIAANPILPGDAPLPFVGRDSELRLLTEALDHALAGAGRIVLLTGEPGIGKTRTAEQVAAVAQTRGVPVLWGHCHSWAGAPPFWPWTQALGALLEPLNDAALRQALGSNAALLAHVVPEIVSRVMEVPPVDPPDSDARLFRVLAATSATLRHAAERQPLVIVLDDIQWADIPSLRLLHVLAQDCRQTPLLLVATYRSDDVVRSLPTSAALADLTRVPTCQRLDLRGLPKPQIARFMALIAGQPPPPFLVDRVAEETSGNPFFVTEVVRLLAEEGQLRGVSPSSEFRQPHVPETVRETIGRRLDHLSAFCHHVLRAASIIGRTFDVHALTQALDASPGEVLAALDEATRAHVIGPIAEPAAYAFSHALVQETLYLEMATPERAARHLSIGQALQARAVGREPPWEILAHHFAQARPLGDAARLVACATRAGDAAMARFAWDAAAMQYARALAALDACAEVNLDRRCHLLLALGEARNRAGSGSGDVPTARANLKEAFALAHTLHDPEGMARAAVAFVGVNIVGAFGGFEQDHMLEEALTALGAADCPIRVRVLGRLAVNLINRSSGTSERGRALADEAVSVAERLADPAQRTFALWARTSVHGGAADFAARVRDASDLIACAEQTGDPLFSMWGYLAQLHHCLERGNRAGAERAMAAIDQIDDRSHMPYITQRTAAFHGMLDLLLGDYASAETWIGRASDLWQSETPRQHQCQRFLLLRDLGRLGELTEDIHVPNELHLWRHAAQAHRMALALARGHDLLARQDFDELMSNAALLQPLTQTWHSVVTRLVEAAVALHDRPGAARLYEAMIPYEDRLAPDGSLVLCHGPIALYLGHLATDLERWDDAARHLDAALALSARLGLRPFVARGLLAKAHWHARRQQPGDRRQARKLLQQAQAAATAIGMRGLDTPCRELLATVASAQDDPFGLTARERDVLHLLVDGLTDAAIAAELSLSPRTINTHLTSIYGKLDVSSRAAAARVAMEHGLV